MKHTLLAFSILLLGSCSDSASTPRTPSDYRTDSPLPSNPAIPPGTETAPPPTTPPTVTTTTGETCTGTGTCANWFCRCADGAVVNSSFCYQGACLAPAAHCPTACARFAHGDWSGNAGGGPQRPAPATCAVSNLTVGNGACGSCAATNCCSALQACDNNPECVAWDRCIGTCDGNQACRDQCDDQHAAGAEAFGAVSACMSGSCAAACR